MDKILSFDIGGTTIKYGIIDIDGNILWKSEIDTEANLGGNHIVDKVKRKIGEIKKNKDIVGVAISTAGIVDTKEGVILEASDTIKDYKGQKLKEVIEKEYNLKVTVENDVNCAALGELWKGAGQNKESIFCLTIGTGVGGAIIINKKIVSGTTFSAGEIGYLNIGDNRLDKTGSTSGIIERFKKRKENIENSEVDGKFIFNLAKNGDRIAIEEIDRMIENIATTIATVAYIINPKVVILGGGITKQEEYLAPRLKKKLKEKLIPYIYDTLEVKFAKLSNNAGMIGAVHSFINSSDEI